MNSTLTTKLVVLPFSAGGLCIEAKRDFLLSPSWFVVKFFYENLWISYAMRTLYDRTENNNKEYGFEL